MGGSAGAGGAAGGSSLPGNMGPQQGAGAGFPGMKPGMMANMGKAGTMMNAAGGMNQQEQMINQLALKGPPPAIQPIPFESGGGLGGKIGQALTPAPPGGGILPRPLRMPMTRGEQLTKPPMPGFGIGQALTGSY